MAAPSKHSNMTTSSRWSLNKFARLFNKKGLRSTPKRSRGPSLSSVHRETFTTQSITAADSDANILAIWELLGTTTNHAGYSTSLDMPPAPSPTPLPRVSTASTSISVACGTSGHHNANGLPACFPQASSPPSSSHPVIFRLTLFGKSLFFIETQRETVTNPPEVELQMNVCQCHILQISTATLFIVQTLAVASATPLSPQNVNVELLSHQLVQLAESLNFLEGEVEFQLRCLNDLADPAAGVTRTGSTGVGLDWQSTTITVGGPGDETPSC
ncbi:hypothetical protein IW261DRAFT_1556919 [Armillaria novae-zelandiae]|uniref:Uncharacterized protein n=1 Tax=Armillaria novae-zelandiae TaxID=153914 RepID=A0AA39PQP9_9AGAR|nr:hypothetical protein IW261DRAFT_1556919 [Armillaria novae-zelandiae]